MNTGDYLKGATSKIFGKKEKEKVTAELNDHILLNREAIEEIGYDPQTAEEKAVEKMGAYEDVAEMLGRLHNDFYNPVGDIIFFLMWALLFTASHYFMSRYTFGDIGASILNIGVAAFSFGLYLIYGAVNNMRNKIQAVIMNIVVGIFECVFILLVLSNTFNTVGGVSGLIDVVLHCAQPTKNSNAAYASVGVSLVFVCLTVFIIILNSIIYFVKYSKCSNTLTDNHIKNGVKKASFFIAALCFALTVLCVLGFFKFTQEIKETHNEVCALAYDVYDNCETFDDVGKYVEGCGYEFEEAQQDSKTVAYSYSGIISNITISKNTQDSKERTFDSALERLAYKIVDTILSKYPESYEKQYDYVINVSLNNLGSFKNGSDSISLYRMATTEKELDRIFNFTAYEHEDEETLNYLKEYSPYNIYIMPSNDKYKHDSEIVLTYSVGNGENSYTKDFDIVLPSQKRNTIDEQKAQVLETIKQNPDASKQEIADLTNAELILPDFTYDEYFSMINEIISISESSADKDTVAEFENEFSDEIESSAKAFYDMCHEYVISDDLSYISYRPNDNTAYVLFRSKTNLTFLGFDAVTFNGSDNESRYKSSYDGMFRKTEKLPDEVYYSLTGNAYKDCEDVPYYTESGKRFRYYEDEETGLYYLISSNGTQYEANFGYIDKDGYLHFFKDGEAKKDGSSEFYYTVGDGNTYTKALETSWDENGNILDFEEYLGD